MTFYRQHPITIFHGISRFLFLLIIPLVRGFFSSLSGGFASWLSGAWFDVVVVGCITALAIIQWRLSFFAYTDEGIYCKKGLFIRQKIFLPAQKITTVSVTRTFYLKPFRAARFTADTLAGTLETVDFSIYTSREHAEQMRQCYFDPRKEDGEFLSREFRPKSIHIALLSIFSSNLFAGIVLVATFSSQLGKVLGQEFSRRIYGTFEKITQFFASGLPPAAAFFAYALLIGWSVGFILNFIRHKQFAARRGLNCLYIKGGIFTNRNYSLRSQDISFLDIRQSLLSKLLGIRSVYLYAPGYGKNRNEVSVVIPATGGHLKETMQVLLPEFQMTRRTLKPNLGAIFKFILEPFWIILAIPVVSTLFLYFFPSWTQLIQYLTWMACIPACWYMLIRLLDWCTSGLSCSGESYTLRYSKGFYLHIVILKPAQIARVDIRQSILQRKDKKCDVKVVSKGEGYVVHHCKNVDRPAAIALFDLVEQYQNNQRRPAPVESII